MKPHIIDMQNDPRAAHFAYFRTMRNPYVSVTANCDITALYKIVKEKGDPFFLTALHCAINAANDVPELRMRIQGEEVVQYDACTSSHTVSLPNGTYCYCNLDCTAPLAQFLPYAHARVEAAKSSPCIDDGEDADSLFFVSCLPWISFTALSLPVAEPADSNVRITMGKYFHQGGCVFLPVNLTAHHALVDGLHIARFFEGFERRAASICSF